MSNRYELLLSPIQVGNVLLKNRMVSTAGIPHMLQGTEEYPTDRLISHLSNRAKNGAAYCQNQRPQLPLSDHRRHSLL